MSIKRDDEDDKLASAKKPNQFGVFGASGVSTICRAQGPVIPEHVFSSTATRDFDGTVLRVASVLGSLGDGVLIITTRTTDSLGPLMERKFANFEDTIQFVIPNMQTPNTILFVDLEGKLALGANIDDMNLQLTVDMLAESKITDRLNQLQVLIIDSSFSPDIYTFLRNTLPNTVDVYVILSSLESAKRIEPILGKCAGIFGKVDELNSLVGTFNTSEDGIADTLRKIAADGKGPKSVFAHGKHGIYAFVNNELIRTKAHTVAGSMSTHAHEAFAAAIVTRITKGDSIEKAIRYALEVQALVEEGKQVSVQRVEEILQQAEQKQQMKGRLLNFAKSVLTPSP